MSNFMDEEKLMKQLRTPHSVNNALFSRFGVVCLDPQATVTAIHDIHSFQNVWRRERNPLARKDRMEKLYNLYLSISKTMSAFSIDHFRYIKSITPGYEKATMSNFLDDISELISAGILIVKTPTLDALKKIGAHVRI